MRRGPGAPGERAVLAVLAAAASTYSLMQSLVIPALPAIQRSLGASPDAASWTVTAFLLSAAVATPIAGRLGDMLGKRRVLVAVLAIVAVGTLLCTIPSIGVIVAGILVQHLSYTWMFWLQIPAFATVAWLVHRFVPGSSVSAPSRIDWTGAVLVSSGLVLLLLTVTQASRWGLGSTATLLGFATAAALLAAWARSALRRADPLLDVRLMLRRAVWTTNAAAFLVGVAQFAGFILIPQYVQEPEASGYGFGASPLASGVFLLPMTIGVLLGGLAAGRLERRFGAKVVLILASVFTTAAFVLLTAARGDAADVYVASGCHGLGAGLALAA